MITYGDQNPEIEPAPKGSSLLASLPVWFWILPGALLVGAVCVVIWALNYPAEKAKPKPKRKPKPEPEEEEEPEEEAEEEEEPEAKPEEKPEEKPEAKPEEKPEEKPTE
jgi:outer membrane biosynthesis protein TonB